MSLFLRLAAAENPGELRDWEPIGGGCVWTREGGCPHPQSGTSSDQDHEGEAQHTHSTQLNSRARTYTQSRTHARVVVALIAVCAFVFACDRDSTCVSVLL
jgi:hypothetical protein